MVDHTERVAFFRMFNPIERNVFIKLTSDLLKDFSLDKAKAFVHSSGAHIEDFVYTAEKNYHQYIAILSESTAAFYVDVEYETMSVFLSTCGSINPLKPLADIVEYYNPSWFEVKYFIPVGRLDDPGGGESGDGQAVECILELQTAILKDGFDHYYDVRWQRSGKRNVAAARFTKKGCQYLIHSPPRSGDAQEAIQSSGRFIACFGIDKNSIKTLLGQTKIEGSFALVHEFESLDPNETYPGLSVIFVKHRGCVAYHVTPERRYASVYYTNPSRNNHDYHTFFCGKECDMYTF